MSSAKAFLKIFQLLHLNYRSYAKIKQEPADFDSLIWQLRLALLSHFTCPDNERPNLRSRRLLVVFHAKANSLALAIFKQRIPISGWFYISTVTTVFVDTRLWKTNHPRKRFQNLDRIEIHQSQPDSITSRRSEGHTSGCDWWISIRSDDNKQD